MIEPLISCGEIAFAAEQQDVYHDADALSVLAGPAVTADGRLALVPAIRRARDYRLYDTQGRRFVDCWLDGGRFLFGHRPQSAGSSIKNSLMRGPTYGLITPQYQRAVAQLAGHFPGFALRVYSTLDAVVHAAAVLGELGPATRVWRPFEPLADVDAAVPASDAWAGVAATAPQCCVVPIIPGVLVPPAYILLVPPAYESAAPPSQIVEPARVASTVAGIAKVRSYRASESLPPQHAPQRNVGPAAGRFDDGYWAQFRIAPSMRRGPYVYAPRVLWRNDAYDLFFARALALGVVVSPLPTWPSVLPAVCTTGERRLVESAFALDAGFMALIGGSVAPLST